MNRVKLQTTMLLGTALAIAAGCSSGSLPTDAVGGHSQGVSLGSTRPGVLGINIDPMNKQASPSPGELAEVGATSVRIELKVAYRPDLSAGDELAQAFDVYDPIISGYAKNDPSIGVLLILDYMTLSQGRSGDWTSAGFTADFAERAGLIAEHYQGLVDHFEIWNEQDLCAGDYCPRVPAGSYASILEGAAKAIHGSSPGARVSSGGMGSGDWETYLQGVVSAMDGAWDEVDAVGLHPYTFWPKAAGAGGNVLEYQLGRVRDISGQKPLWLTEWGDGGSQAEMMKSYFAFFADGSIAESSYVEDAWLFAWSDSQQESTAFGLFDRDGDKKEEWSIFRDAAAGSKTSDPPPPPPDPGGASCAELASASGWEGAICGGDACAGLGSSTSDCSACCAGTSRLHGAVEAGGAGIEGLLVSAWGHDKGDLHTAKTDALGIFAFEGLDASSQYNIVVNAEFDPKQGYMPVDPGHDMQVRDNVLLVSGPDGWHGENFSIAY